jgi:uncharacterized protein DUF5667
VTSESERLELLAERLRMVQLAVPSPGAKIRGWNLVLAEVEHSASRTRPRLFPRIVLVLVVIAVLLSAAVATSSDSLPDSPFYPMKRVVETARGALTFSSSGQFAFHLSLAMTRLREGEAMIASHRVDFADQSLVGLDDELNAAALVVQRLARTDRLAAADLRAQLAQAVASDDRQLFGLQAEVTDPAAIAAMSRAREGAQRALVTAAQTAAPKASP